VRGIAGHIEQAKRGTIRKIPTSTQSHLPTLSTAAALGILYHTNLYYFKFKLNGHTEARGGRKKKKTIIIIFKGESPFGGASNEAA
jgi:hypothetical protein